MIVNGLTINVPGDMSVVKRHAGLPNACDCIVYRGVEIYTHDAEPTGRAYDGPFAVLIGESGGPTATVATLDAARAVIDAR